MVGESIAAMIDRIPLPGSSLATWCPSRRLPGRRNRFPTSPTNDSDHAKCFVVCFTFVKDVM